MFADGPSSKRDAQRRTQAPRVIDSAGTPTAEALRATRVAARTVRELYDSGREVRFARVSTQERVAVLLCDVDGGVLAALTPSKALEIATGQPCPQAPPR